MDLALNNLQRLICHKLKQPTDNKEQKFTNPKMEPFFTSTCQQRKKFTFTLEESLLH